MKAVALGPGFWNGNRKSEAIRIDRYGTIMTRNSSFASMPKDETVICIPYSGTVFWNMLDLIYDQTVRLDSH